MKNKIFTMLLTTLVMVSGMNVFGQFSGGDGSSGTPWEVATVADLNNVRNYLGNGVYFIQTANIDLNVSPYNTGDGWEPIGNDLDGQRFLGNYDGDGFTISGLFINRPTEGEVGLFGCVGRGTATHSAVIRNVKLINVQDISGARGTGSLIGRVRGDVYTLTENCSSSGSGTVSGNGATGGLVGANNSYQTSPGPVDNPTISQCWSSLDVLAVIGGNGDKFGGLVGCNQKGNTVNSYARGSVTVPASGTFERIGGLIGCADIRGTAVTSFSTGAVTTNGNPNATLVGGLVGNLSGPGNNQGTVTDSYWDTQTSGQSTSAGGTGYNTTQMKVQPNFVGFDFTNIWNIDGSTNDGYPFLLGTDVTTYITWTGGTNSDWSTTTNWNLTRIPIASDIAVIPAGLTNYPIITSTDDIVALPKDLDILDGAGLTINPLGKFEIQGRLRPENSTGLIIKSDDTGTGSLLHNSNDVPGTIYRYITGAVIPGSGDAIHYHTVSIPLTQSSNPLSGLFIDSYLYRYDHAENDKWVAYGAPVDTPLDVDQGYLIYYPEDVPRTYTFTGTLNNDEFEAAVKQVGTATKTLNLVPNPYPSAIDWDLVDKTDVDNAIWIWNPNIATANYATYVDGQSTNGGSRYIPVGQAFFVRTSSISTVSPTLVLDNSVRVHNDQAFFKNKEQQPNVLRIQTLANNYSDEIVVRFRDGATNNFDSQFDAGKMFGMGGSPQLYSMSADGQQLSINSIPATTEQVSIPLGFELETNGEVTFVASSIESFDAEMPIFLWDKQADKKIDLRTNPQYTFLHDPYDENMRFELLLNSAVSVEDIVASSVNILIYYSDSQLNLNIPAEVGDNPMVNVFNTSGQLVYSAAAKTGSSSITLPGISRGIYMVQVTGENHAATEKVSIN